MADRAGRRFTRRERSWILYDWANSVYATNIMAAIFPTIFVAHAGAAGDRMWALGTSAATLIVALLAPFLGALADYRGMKKRLFAVFLGLGVLSTALIALTEDWRVMLVFYVLSHIGFSGSCLFYDSFLTDVTTPERMDRVSAWGYAMGYIGGSTIPFVLSIVVLMQLGDSHPAFAQKFSILITSLWWLVFSVPFLKNVRQEYGMEPSRKPSAAGVLRGVSRTAREILARRGLFLFVLAYFFYIDGVGTVISISTAYGTALGLGRVAMILALLVTQLVAMPFSILFARVARRVTTRRALLFAIGVYMFICSVGFVMGFTLEPHQEAYEGVFEEFRAQARAEALEGASGEGAEALEDALEAYLLSLRSAALNPREGEPLPAFSDPRPEAEQSPGLPGRLDALAAAFTGRTATRAAAYAEALRRSTVLFWSMAILVGTVQGGIQAMSRSYFGKLIPRERSNEFFGFFDIFGKFATVIGPLLYALVGNLTGRSSFGTLGLLLLFLLGFLLLARAREALEKEEAGGAA